MARYIIKESQLRSAIEKVVAEELNNALNEGLGHALWSGAKNTAKLAALGTVAPALLATKAVNKTNNILNGPDTITQTVRQFFGADDASNKSRTDKHNKRMQNLRDERTLRTAYGRPDTTPRVIGRKDKLVGKVSFNTEEFGNLGRHYADIDGVWNRELERARNDVAAHPNLQRRLKRQLKEWLEERDKAYIDFIKNS